MHVLLVDDDRAFRERVAKALEERGHRVSRAATAEEAWQSLEAGVPDAALLDLRMPGESGLMLLRKLHDRCPTLRIVVLTGYGSIATAIEAVRLGAADYLTKPLDAQQIEDALKGVRTVTEDDLPVPSLERVEWEHLQRVLAQYDNNISVTARALGIDRRTLQRKLNRLPPQQ